jgi:hypothetical protein
MSRTRRLPRWRLVAAVTLASASGFSQSQGDGDDPPPAAPAPAGGPAAAAPAAPPAASGATYGPNFVPAPGTKLEGYLPSSSQAKGDIYTPDGFDLKRGSGSVPTLRGNPDNLGILNVDTAAGAGEMKSLHVVRKGDTLWGICGEQLGDSRLWPRIWAQNPQLQNPHWIYPGDQLRLRQGGAADGAIADTGRAGIRGGTLGSGMTIRTALVPPETVFLRELGYIDEPDQDVWGQVVGAREEQQLLSDGNRVYMVLRPGAQVQIGQQMTVFEDVRDPPAPEGARRPPGKIVSFKGTIKIDAWDAKTRVARGEVIESLDIIERGAKVGPVGRRFYVVPPAASEVQIQARVLTSLYPHVIMGRDQVVFIDRGANDGLKPGNRLFVVRKGDAWRRTLETASVMARSRIRMEVPERVELEVTELEGDEESFPEEVVAELRVIRSHRFSSLAVITESSEEIEPGDQAVTRKGY